MFVSVTYIIRQDSSEALTCCLSIFLSCLGAFLSLKLQILAWSLTKQLVIKGNNSCQKQCFKGIYLMNMKTYILKLSYVFDCNLIYKLKLIKQNVIFCSYFHIKIDRAIQGQ